MAKGWSDEELLASVTAYRKMARQQDHESNSTKKQVYENLSMRFGRPAKAFEYRMQNISAVLEELNLPWIRGLKPAVNVGTDIKTKLIQLIENDEAAANVEMDRIYNMRAWEKVIAAVNHLGGKACREEIEDWILSNDPSYNTENLTDLYMLSVNSPSRVSYSQNRRPRRTDEGSRYDRLFKVGNAVFETYDIAQHGVWEIYPDALSKSRFGVSIRQISTPIDDALVAAETADEEQTDFSPSSVVDARNRVSAEIVRRRGQPAFRRALLNAYGNACAITGCSLSAVLEAAHVHPYKGGQTNGVSNGLLLRADIHTLFDLGLIAVESKSMVIRISPELEGTEYEGLEGCLLRHPKKKSQRVNPEALDWHRSQRRWDQ